MKKHKKTVIREAFQHSNRSWDVTLDNFEFDGRNFLVNADVDREAAVIDHEPDFGDRHGRGDQWGSESTGVSDIEIVEWDENGNETQIDPMAVENKELVKAAEEAAMIQSDEDAKDEPTSWGKPKRGRDDGDYDDSDDTGDHLNESQLRKLVELVTEVVSETKAKKRKK